MEIVHLSDLEDGDVLVADTEANGLIIPGPGVQLATHMLCLGVLSLTSGEYRAYWGDEIPQGIERLRRAKTVVGHNFVEYDRTLIHRLYGVSLPLDRIHDTLMASRFVGVPEHEYSIRNGKGRKGKKLSPHSLEALGLVLGAAKQEFDHEETQGLTPEGVSEELRAKLLEYMEQDVRLNAKAYELRFKEILEPLTIQQINGFAFDTEAAQVANEEIAAEVEELAKAFSDSLALDIIPKKRVRAVKTREVALAAPDPAVDHTGFPRTATLEKGQWYQPFKFVPVSPGSPKQVTKAFCKLGWKPTVYTDSGAPALDKDVVPTIPLRQAGMLLEYRERANLLSKLSKGDKSWLRHVVNDRLHGGVISIGANTHRMSHSKPNLAQVPTKGNVRRLFRASEGFVLVDADAVSIEARMMAHFLYKHDKGLYRRRVLNGEDVHTMNQQAIGAVSRAIAKNILYAYCYGSSPFGLGQQWVTAAVQAGEMEQTPSEAEIAEIGNFIKQQFDKTIPGLSKLIAEAKKEFKDTGSVVALDGRPLVPGAEISAFNTRVQGSAAILMKRALWFLHGWAKVQPYPIRYVANVHDEIIVETPPAHAEIVVKATTDAIVLAGEYYEMNCPMAGEAKIGPTWADVH